MNISELIDKLTLIKMQHGDLPVNVFDPEKMEDGELVEVEACITFSCDENEKIDGVTLCDPETHDSFFETEEDDG